MQVNQEGICSKVVGLYLSVLRSLLLEMLLFSLGTLSLHVSVCECICLMCVWESVYVMHACGFEPFPMSKCASLLTKKSRWLLIQLLSYVWFWLFWLYALSEGRMMNLGWVLGVQWGSQVTFHLQSCQATVCILVSLQQHGMPFQPVLCSPCTINQGAWLSFMYQTF